MIPDTDLPEVLAAQLIFWALLPIVLFGSIRWAVIAWLIMGNLDTTGPGQSSLVGIGWINAAKGVALPAYLLWQLRQTPTETWRALPTRLWLALTAYATIAVIWTPFQLAGAKLVGNMAGTLITIIVVEKAARIGALSTRGLVALSVASLGLGALQTFYFGGAVYGFDGADQPPRFTSFVAAQQFAALLVALLTAGLWNRALRRVVRVPLCALLAGALLLNGSRIWCIGALLVLVAYTWSSSQRAILSTAFAAATLVFGVALVVNLDLARSDLVEDTPSRIIATASAVLTGQDTAQGAGLRNLGFRLAIYDDVLRQIHDSRAREIIFGNGTSSGGTVVLRVFPYMFTYDRLDPNRAIHNEWLRALYEWGVVGLMLLVSVFCSLLIGLIVRSQDHVWKARAAPALAFVPSFLGALSTENILAGTGNAVTMSLAIVVALLWSPHATFVATKCVASTRPLVPNVEFGA
jgi:hypothetical protein